MHSFVQGALIGLLVGTLQSASAIVAGGFMIVLVALIAITALDLTLTAWAVSTSLAILGYNLGLAVFVGFAYAKSAPAGSPR